MLPAIVAKPNAFKRKAVAALIALGVALPAAPALAWGQREQDVLKGVVGTLLVQGAIREIKDPRQPVYVQPRQVYVQPEPVYVEPRYERHHRGVSIYGTAAAQAFNSYSSSERRLIQRRLSSYGYYRGGIDGSFGPGTYSAVVAYAQDEGESLRSTASAFGVYDSLIY
jgi:hypothetical protein